MSSETLDVLLSKLNAGDAQAAERVFLEYEPYLRMVVRRRLTAPLRAKFDSMDVVQSVWADLLDGLQNARWAFTNANQLRAFLVKMTRNRFIDGLRHHRPALAREVCMDEPGLEALPASAAPRVSEEFYANELWQQMLDACPPAHYELLAMKRQGATIAEIAERTQMHEGSVRRILYDVARRVAQLRTTGDPGPR